MSEKSAVREGVARIRWFNRLAAWLYPHVTDPLMNLALPVWQAEADADAEEEERETNREMDEVFRAGAEHGYREGREDAGSPW